jgi:hypothetical protein
MALFVSSFHFLIKVASQFYMFPFLLVITEINEGYEEKLCTPSFAVVKCCDVPQGGTKQFPANIKGHISVVSLAFLITPMA